MLRFSRLYCLLSGLLLASIAALAQPAAPVAQDTSQRFVVDKIIAKVDNYIVLKSDLAHTYQSYITEGNPPSEKVKCEMLNRLVINKLLVAKAEIDSVFVTDVEVDQSTEQRMSILLQNAGNSQEELEKAFNKTFTEIKIEIRETIREQLLAREMTNRITKDISVTPSEVKRFISKVPKDSLPYYSSDVEVAQIVRVAKISEAQKEIARNRLLKIREELMQGGNFNELAKKYSEDPTAQTNGGELGRVPRGSMVPEYEAMAFKMKDGEISQPFLSNYGYHLMQLIERRGNEYNSRNILIAATPSEEDLKRATKFLDSLRGKILKDSIPFGIAAKLFSDDKNTKEHGGFFADQDGSTKMPLKDLENGMYFIIDGMKQGDITKPLPYRTDEGKQAMRIIYFKTKVPPHQANIKDDWFRIQVGALGEKKDKTLDKWFRKARTDVFINIDPLYNGCKIME
jgi:peptidyl-prolyl cis-trans isomerase SurA